MKLNKLKSTALPPIYTVNYNAGYLGFESNNTDLVNNGISYITRWERLSDVSVSHCFLVTSDKTCIESTLNDGVKEVPLDYYFASNKAVFFRKPRNINSEVAQIIVDLARKEIGKKYDIGSILVQLLSGTFAGRLLTNSTIDSIAKLIDDKDKWICSELCAYLLEKGFNQDLFPVSNNSLSPQELFESNVFTPWHKT